VSHILCNTLAEVPLYIGAAMGLVVSCQPVALAIDAALCLSQLL
jgi:hypothetical protein